MNKTNKSVKTAGKAAIAKPAAAKPSLHAIKGGKPASKAAAAKPIPVKAASPAADDAPVIALNLPTAKLSPAMAAYFKKCQDKLGFIPNVLVAYAFDMTKLEAFVAMYNDLMLGESGLSKLEREMIAVAVSSQNRCYYCLTAHGAAVRQYSGNPLLGEQIVMNYRAARLNKRQRAMLDFAVKLTAQPAVWRTATASGCAAPASPTATSGTSRRSPASSTCRTASLPPPTCGRTRSITARRGKFVVPAKAGTHTPWLIDSMVAMGPGSRSLGRDDSRGWSVPSIMNRFIRILSCAVLLLSTFAHAQVAPVDRTPAIPPATAVLAHNGMVVAQESRAARIGIEILDRGGNAVDAAVAVGFAMAVTYPRAGNLGGGGFMVIHLARENRDIAIDYRETAPAAATPAMFLDAKGNPDPAKSRDTGLAVGVPGTVAGLALAHKKYGSGKLSLADLIAPAIRLAQQGFPVEDDTADSLPKARERLARWPSSAGIFLNGGEPLHEGDRLLQFDLADTLQAIADGGPRAFYEGRIAEQIAAAVRGAGGIMTADDLKNYRAVERAPCAARYRGYDIVSMPPPSSGGVALIEMLNILEGYDLGKLARAEQALHDMIEAMKRAYADRAVYMGDPDSVKMPIAGLLSKKYAATLRASITDKATPAAAIKAGKPRRHRRQEHDAFLHHRPRRQRGVEHLHAEFQLRSRLGRRRHRRPAQQRARRFHRQARHRQRLRSGRLQRQSAGAGQAAAVVDDADHRLEGRQAVSDHRLARRQPHHHHGAAGDRQRHRFPYAGRQGGRARRACTTNGSRTRLMSSRALRPRCSMRSKRAATSSYRPSRTARPIRSR